MPLMQQGAPQPQDPTQPPPDPTQQGAPPDPLDRLDQMPANMKQAPPQMQKQFAAMIKAAGMVIYDKKLSAQLLAMIKSSGNALAMAAQAAAMLVEDLDRRLNVADGVILPAAIEILGMILDLCEETGILPNLDQPTFQKALQGMMGVLAEAYGSDISDLADVHQQMQGATAGPPPQGALPIADDPSLQGQPGGGQQPPQPPPGAANGPAQ